MPIPETEALVSSADDSRAIATIPAVPQNLDIVGEVHQLPLDQNPAAVYLATLRPTGRRAMLHSLNVMADLVQPGATALTLAWASLRYQHTAAIASALVDIKGWQPATVNRSLCALRGVLKQAWNLRQMDSEDYRRAVNFKSGYRNETLPRGRALGRGELLALLEGCACDPGPSGIRDAAMIAVLYGAGLRRSEVVKLELANYDAEAGSLTVRGGKGNKDRLVYLEEGGAAAMTDWLALRGREPGALFNPINKGGRISADKQRKMADQVVLEMLRKRAKQAGVKSFSPHDLRRTFISDLLDAGADIATVQKLAGHADVSTTARYDRRGEVAKKKAAGLLHVPYQSRRLPL